jgi:hypothetical protein
MFVCSNIITEVSYLDFNGRAIAQAVIRSLSSTMAARVRNQVRSCGIYGGQSGTGVGFLRVHPFFLPILIPPTDPHSSSHIIRGWYNRRNRSGLSRNES